MKIKILTNIFYWTTIILLVVACGLVTSSAFNLPYGAKLYSVMSGSMEPNIPVGSLIISTKGEYNTGDVIIYKSGDSSTTHRIVDVKTDGQESLFLTKGDANNSNDGKLVSKSLILGKVFFAIPLLGYFSAYIKTLPGLIIFIVIPATVIAYNELLNLIKALKREINKKYVKSSQRWNKIVLGKTIIFLIFSVGVAAVKTLPTNSFYAADSAKVTNSVSVRKLLPQASIFLSSDKETATITAKNISEYIKLSYNLTYDTDSLPQAAAGQVDLHGENEFIREITLGACSSGGICVYHSGIKNFNLKVDLDDSTGNTIKLSATL